MRVVDLTVIVLQQVGAVAVQHAGPPRRERSRMAPGLDALPACFDADQADVGVVQERMKQTHRVGAAADAGDQRVRQPSFGLQDLLPHLVADHGLEITDQRRVRMRSRHRADDVEGVLDVRDPVTKRLVHGVLQRARA